MVDTPRRTFVRRLGAAGIATTGLAQGAAAEDSETNRNGGRTRGRLDKLGQALPPGGNPDHVTYTFGHVSPDGTWGAISSFPEDGNVMSSLYDLSELENPELVHEIGPPNDLTRSNDIKFDPNREGIYIRSLEADDEGPLDDPVADTEGLEGIEVVDFGCEVGTPTEPEVVATLETPYTGVHKLTDHPEETVLYLVDKQPDEPGILAVDFSDHTDPTVEAHFGPDGYCHDMEVDTVRDALHAAYIFGDNVGYATFDISDPLNPTQLGFFDYDDQPDYETVGEPGFELAHQIHPEPNRDLAIMGDEVFDTIPGGKHVFDIGWGEGSLEDPKPIAFMGSPDAREQEEGQGVWTTHFHDVIYDRGEVLLVDGGYTQGMWVANITDPCDPTPTERYATDDGIDNVDPYCWSAYYNEARGFAFAADSATGAYTFDVSALPARGEDGGGPDGHFDLDAILDDAE
ncbi:LVIVD repeat-containing protein [Natronococcus amylolyticus DSM 10524]|uniref:LVIVD repeat-containing protein n=1 Tax=Natronococcus amylolyticus DSM 10524 TaxID=1227497 RepID=L9X0X2_9EURY|nr:hypothetical protein [Natronococcus amylolyticus]ELY55404.1 LVIVD repeat-containing protein [Natronococcus amylolyticus DSM 10524]